MAKKQIKASEVKKKLGKPKYIETPEKMWSLFEEYKKHTKDNPITVKDWVGKDAMEVLREKEVALTIEGFELFCEDKGEINDLGDYFKNKDNRYADYAPICSRIKRAIRHDQISGGLAGIYNPSITQRLNSLVDKQEIKVPKVGLEAEKESYED